MLAKSVRDYAKTTDELYPPAGRRYSATPPPGVYVPPPPRRRFWVAVVLAVLAAVALGLLLAGCASAETPQQVDSARLVAVYVGTPDGGRVMCVENTYTDSAGPSCDWAGKK
jgi:hypothetical protein